MCKASIELMLYAEYIRELADNNSADIFHNAGAQYASIVFANIFRKAKYHVRIYSKAMNQKVTANKDYLKELRGFLDRGGKLSVMVEDVIDPQGKLSTLLGYYPDNVKIKPNVGQVFNYKDKSGETYPVHFATADGQMFRVENDVNGHKARGSFNQVDDSKKLETLFDKVFSS
ncbi:hypothetical protein [uncultured Draconibacterium sp.]|uniref:hypothetical protein n=1 Tax=uncultured Draconibacterium sp. TaxID=1573823 RepID=UPI0025F63013|nr:hypothetical protein [uncultured Draconibacterium sp.]